MSIPGLLREFDCDPEAVLASVGLDIVEFSDPDTEIPYFAASRLLARCVSATGCEHFGLLVGGRAGPSSLGVAGFMLGSASDIATALHDLQQHLNLHDQGGMLVLRAEEDIVLLGYAIQETRAEATDQIYDLSIALACNIMRNLCGQSWNPTEVLLSRRLPQDLMPYRGFFRAPLHFDAAQSGVKFPGCWLSHKLVSADPLLHRHLEKEALALHGLRNLSIIETLRCSLRKHLLNGSCTVTDVSRELRMHHRSLNRRLRDHGTSFREELDNVRYIMACQLLADSMIPIARIATILNYSDATGFSRAFKRWSGTTPARWRNGDRPCSQRLSRAAHCESDSP
jgi:AraC-like DNA-binding protein